MAISKCPKCESTSFELKTNSPSGSNYKYSFIQCSSCGSVVGVMEFFNIGHHVQNLDKKLDEINSKLDRLERKIK